MDSETSPAQPERTLALKVLMMPNQVNHYGTIFGGVILSDIDRAAAVQARHHGLHRWVTACFEKVEFKKPILVGDIVSYYTWTIKTGTKSVTIGVEVDVERHLTGETEHVTTAQVVMVSVDPKGRSIPFVSPSTVDY